MPINDSTGQGDSADLDHWLEDSGRRKHSAEWVASLYAQTSAPPASRAAQKKKSYVTQPGLLFLFATAAVAFAMQYFIEVQLTIASLPGVIIFAALR